MFNFGFLENTNVNTNANPKATIEANQNPNWWTPPNLIDKNANAIPPTPIPFANTLNPVEITAANAEAVIAA